MSHEVDTRVDGVLLGRFCGPATDDGSERTFWQLSTYPEFVTLTRAELFELSRVLLAESTWERSDPRW